LLKNGHQSRASRDFPHPSPCQARGRLVAAYSQVRLRPAHQLAGVARSRSLSVATPPSGFRGPPANGISQGSTCICPSLSNLKKRTSHDPARFMELPFLIKCIKLLALKSMKIFGPCLPRFFFSRPSLPRARGHKTLPSQNKDLITRRQLAKMLWIERRVVTASESDQGIGFSFQKVRLHEA
jgi:hypothetical protein